MLWIAGVVLLAMGDRPMYASKPVNIAHRGASAYAPEHTLAAYRLAVEMKADFVEPDLQLTKDGQLICMHDASLERTTNVSLVFPERFHTVKGKKHWMVADFTLSEIKQLDAGSWFNKKFAGERVPTFQEMVDVVKGHAGIIPETKSPESHENSSLSMEQALMAVLKKNGLDLPGANPKSPVVIQSFSLKSLQKLRKDHQCKLPMLLLFPPDARDDLTPELFKQLKKDVDGIGPAKIIVLERPDIVKQAHDAGLRVTVFTCRAKKPEPFGDVKSEMQHFLKTGVDAIFTDNPDLFPRE